MMTTTKRVFLAQATGSLVSLATPMIAQTVPIDSELIFFIDCSSSMYESSSKIIGLGGITNNYIVQRDGHVQAISQPDIRQAIIENRIYVRIVLWAQNTTQEVYSDLIDSEVKHAELVGAFMKQTPSQQLAKGTVHLDCLNFMLETPRVGQYKRAGDISTDDSLLNDWRGPTAKLRDMVYASGHDQVNVLSLNHPNNTQHLRNHLQTPNGVTIDIDNHQKPITLEGYTKALKKKILLEIAWLTSSTTRRTE